MGIDVDVDVDMDSDMAVSITWVGPSKGAIRVGVDMRQVFN